MKSAKVVITLDAGEIRLEANGDAAVLALFKMLAMSGADERLLAAWGHGLTPLMVRRVYHQRNPEPRSIRFTTCGLEIHEGIVCEGQGQDSARQPCEDCFPGARP